MDSIGVQEVKSSAHVLAIVWLLQGPNCSYFIHITAFNPHVKATE